MLSIPNTQPFAMSATATQSTSPRKRRSVLFWVLTVGGLALAGEIGLGLATGHHSPVTTDPATTAAAAKAQLDGMICRFAEREVKDSLKSPGTAKFAGCRLGSKDGGAHWTVTGTVEAQNGFGALLRSTYVVDVVKSGDTMKAVRVSVL
jgi:alkanesulfonate monooxygenase SsuD/methylene tetrahydromethanopterin reductase-like flavin-dependent oxidoreductase (luciferase family)